MQSEDSVPYQEAQPSKEDAQDDAREQREEGLIKRALLTPVVFISFLLSLALVDGRNRAYRAQPSSPDTRWSRAWRGLLSAWPTSAAVSNPASIQGQQADAWRWTSTHRRMMKLEIVQALDLRDKVVGALIFLGLILAAILAKLLARAWVNLYGG